VPLPLTERQKDVVEAIRAYWDMYGFAPSHRDLAKILDITPHAVVEHLTRLRVKGWVAFGERKARTIRLLVRTVDAKGPVT
jgi:SOS-response transcriptional repressor LexA